MAINPTTIAKLTAMYSAAKGPGAKARITGDMRTLGYPEEVILQVKGNKESAAAIRKATLASLLVELNTTTVATVAPAKRAN